MTIETVHVEDAFDALMRRIAELADVKSSHQSGYDIKIPDVANSYWHQRNIQLQINDPSHKQYYLPFYDAAWRLCIMGVLRPGQTMPSVYMGGRGFDGDGYCITEFGRTWAKRVNDRPASDPSRFGALLEKFQSKFGPGYKDRTTEAVRCYQTGNYLACCVLSGAASESILLALAIAKTADESKILKDYRSANGRKKITDFIVGKSTEAIAGHFRTSLGILSYWRDEAGHGLHTTIGEIEAYAALSQLIRLAQFSDDNWSILTTT